MVIVFTKGTLFRFLLQLIVTKVGSLKQKNALADSQDVLPDNVVQNL
jgi:hypothetical protein